MKSFHKDYTKDELKIIIKAWNKHFRIYTTGKTKKELADELDKYLEHDENGVLDLKDYEVRIPDVEKGRKNKSAKPERSKSPMTMREKSIGKNPMQTEAEKEKSRIQSYSNTKATASLPQEMLNLIYEYLPHNVKETVEKGTLEEQKNQLFKKKYAHTKRGAEDLYSDLVDKSGEFAKRVKEAIDSLIDNNTWGWSKGRKERMMASLTEDAESVVVAKYIKIILELLKEGKTTREVSETLFKLNSYLN
jgi:hypothetical protein